MNDTATSATPINPSLVHHSVDRENEWDTVVSEVETPNIALAPEEVATLQSLIQRYDKVIQDLDVLNSQIETLLAQETIKACDS